MSQKMNPVVHFEMPAEDRERMANFYTKTFGWKTTLLGEDMMNYTLVQTDETDENGMLKETNRINGGFYPKDPNHAEMHPSVVIGVDDIQESMKKITEGGGTVQGEPMEIPGYGMYVAFLDTEGNRVGMMQPLMTNK